MPKDKLSKWFYGSPEDCSSQNGSGFKLNLFVYNSGVHHNRISKDLQVLQKNYLRAILPRILVNSPEEHNTAKHSVGHDFM